MEPNAGSTTKQQIGYKYKSQSLKPKRRTRKKFKKRSQPLGVLMILGGLVFLAFMSYFTDPARSKLVTLEDFQVFQGTFMGTYFSGGRRELAFKTTTKSGTVSVIIVGMNQNVRPATTLELGDWVQVTCTKGIYPEIIQPNDLKELPNPNPILFLPKTDIAGAWVVKNGVASNGSNRYPTQLPNMVIDQLHAIRVGGSWCAVL